MTIFIYPQVLCAVNFCKPLTLTSASTGIAVFFGPGAKFGRRLVEAPAANPATKFGHHLLPSNAFRVVVQGLVGIWAGFHLKYLSR